MKKLFVLLFATLLLNGNAFASDDYGIGEFCDTPYGQEFAECADHENPEHHDYLRGVVVSIKKCQGNPHNCGIEVKVSTYDPHTGHLYIPRVEVHTGHGYSYYDADLTLFPEHDGYVFGVHGVHELDWDDYGFECVVYDILEEFFDDFGMDYDIDYCDEHEAEEDMADEPVTEEPATEEPATQCPSQDAATQCPATEEPATEEPATEEPATEEPATEEPATTDGETAVK